MARHWIVWSVETFDEDDGLHLVRLSPDGVILEDNSTIEFTLIRTSPASTHLRHSRLARVGPSLVHVWVDGIQVGGQAKDIEGAFLFPF